MLREYLGVVQDVLTVLLVVAGLLIFFFKETVKGWVRARFEKAVSKEVDDYRHQLSRDLEAYKAAALRDFEAYRANIDIRRSISLQFELAKLEAIRKLRSEFDNYSTLALSFTKYPDEDHRKTTYDELSLAFQSARGAFRAASVFLEQQLNVDIVRIHSTMWGMVAECLTNNAPLHDGDERVAKALGDSADILIRLGTLVKEAGAFAKE